jgi:hypothetical protein
MNAAAAARIHPLLLLDSNRRTLDEGACSAGGEGGPASAPASPAATDHPDSALVSWGLVGLSLFMMALLSTQALEMRVRGVHERLLKVACEYS